MSNQFQWHGEDKDDVIVPSVRAIAVYINLNGDVAIRQEGDRGEEDVVIVVPKSHARAVAKAITEATKGMKYEPKTGDL